LPVSVSAAGVGIALDPAAPMAPHVEHQMSTPRPADGHPDRGALGRGRAVAVDPLPRSAAVQLATYPIRSRRAATCARSEA
jgi:hypothetical protein